MARVWIVNPFDNLPCEGYRPQRFWLMARAFAKAGHETTLWTSSFSHANKARRRFLRPLEGEGFRIRLVDAPGYRANVCLRRIFSHLALAHRWRTAAEAEALPEVIVVSSPPLALVAAVRKFAAAHGIRYVVDVMDAWPETFERVLPKFVLRGLGLYALARRNYAHAKRISVVANRYRELVSAYGVQTPCRIFHHGIEPVDRGSGAPPPRHRDLASATHLVYVGNMSATYDLATVVAVVREMSEVTLDLAGSGPDEPRLRRLAGDCPRIRFCGYLGEGELRELLDRADAGIVPMLAESCVGVPYKLADYAAAGLPIVNSLEGETASLLARHGAGFNYRAKDAASLCAALRQLQSADWNALVVGVRKLADLFDANVIYEEYVKWIF